jgi:predicted RNase H-like HicB family nuclease
MHRYPVEVTWSPEDGVFIARVPDLPGCIAHGETRALAEANAQQAMQLWSDTAREFGDPIPEPRA